MILSTLSFCICFIISRAAPVGPEKKESWPCVPTVKKGGMWGEKRKLTKLFPLPFFRKAFFSIRVSLTAAGLC